MMWIRSCRVGSSFRVDYRSSPHMKKLWVESLSYWLHINVQQSHIRKNGLFNLVSSILLKYETSIMAIFFNSGHLILRPFFKKFLLLTVLPFSLGLRLLHISFSLKISFKNYLDWFMEHEACPVRGNVIWTGSWNTWPVQLSIFFFTCVPETVIF